MLAHLDPIRPKTNPSISSSSQVWVENMQVNDWNFPVITIPKWAASALSALLTVCLQRSGKHYAQGRSHKDVVSRCFRGMSCELALCLWLKSLGFSSTMAMPRIGPDDGWDVKIEGGQSSCTIDVKGSLFRDNRWIQHLRLNDKCKISLRKRDLPNLYAWAILDPKSIQPSAEYVQVGIVALLPRGSLVKTESQLEISFDKIKSYGPQFAPDEFALTNFGALTSGPRSVRFPEPSVKGLAKLVRRLTYEMDLLNESRRHSFVFDIILNGFLMSDANKLIHRTPILQCPQLVDPLGIAS